MPQEIVTIGDGLNDLDMTRDFNGFAIENSSLAIFDKELKTAASIAKLVDDKLK